MKEVSIKIIHGIKEIKNLAEHFITFNREENKEENRNLKINEIFELFTFDKIDTEKLSLTIIWVEVHIF